MRHKSCTTTLGYINPAEQVHDAVKAIKTPEGLKETVQPTGDPEQRHPE